MKSFDFDSELLKAPKILKDYVHQFWDKKEFFYLQERHNYNNDLDLPNKNFFFKYSTVDIFSACYCYNFISSYNHSYVYTMQAHKFKSLVTSLALQQIKEVGIVA